MRDGWEVWKNYANAYSHPTETTIAWMKSIEMLLHHINMQANRELCMHWAGLKLSICLQYVKYTKADCYFTVMTVSTMSTFFPSEWNSNELHSVYTWMQFQMGIRRNIKQITSIKNWMKMQLFDDDFFLSLSCLRKFWHRSFISLLLINCSNEEKRRQFLCNANGQGDTPVFGVCWFDMTYRFGWFIELAIFNRKCLIRIETTTLSLPIQTQPIHT